MSFQWHGTANDSFGARITGCFANFPDGNNFWTYFGGTFGGNYTSGNCYYNNRYLGTPGNYPITVGFFLNNGSTMSITQNVQVIAPTPGVYTSGDVVETATSVEGAPATFSAYGYDYFYGYSDAGCSPQSGNTFPMGSTVVNCSATNPAGNTGTSQFTVTVNKGTPAMGWAQPSDLIVGQSVASILKASMDRADATGSISYFDADDNELTPETILPMGNSQAIRAVYNPTGPAADAYNHTETVRNVNVLPRDFNSGPQATITGDAQVDEELTAHTVASDPVPDSYTYQWFADDTAIDGQTGETFTPTTDQLGDEITVAVSAVKAEYATTTATSPATDPVVANTVTLTGAPTLEPIDGGTPQVGELLSADDTDVTASPTGAAKSHQWLRDGDPIVGASGAEYLLTNDDAGHLVSFQVGASKTLYHDATPVTTDAVGPVDGGDITLPTPAIAGDPVVDETLNATLPDGLSPADAAVAWQWYSDEAPVGDGTGSYSPGADDVGHAITVTATATKDHLDTATQTSDATARVASATFSSPPVAGIDGTVKVGETLTALSGSVVPDTGTNGYQWYADGHEIAGATGSTYVLQAAQRHTRITVQVTATKPGYDSVSDLSDETADVATELDPDLSFTTDDSTIRRGENTGLTWSTVDADTVTASGAWDGAKAMAGTSSVSPNDLGQTTYVLEATNENGATTSQVTVDVTRAAKTLGVTAPDGLRLAGRRLPVTARGLDAGEAYAVTVGGIQVATGTAGPSGSITRSVRVPSSTREGDTPVIVTGSESDRGGTDTVRVVRNKTLGMRLSQSIAHKRQLQAVTVTGLAAGEKVTVRYRGKRLTSRSAHANANGTYRMVFRIGRLAGTKYVTATGQFAGRKVTKTFTVTRF